jgi:hypothetical protein
MNFRVVYELSKYYLKDQTKKTLRKTVRCYEDYLTKVLSNSASIAYQRFWRSKNSWASLMKFSFQNNVIGIRRSSMLKIVLKALFQNKFKAKIL